MMALESVCDKLNKVGGKIVEKNRWTAAAGACLPALLFIIIILQFNKGVLTVASGVFRVDDITNTI